MKEKMKESKVKIVCIAASIILTLFIAAIIIGVVTHTTWQALLRSILTVEIQFAIELSLMTSIISTILCIVISIPVAYALARYEFPEKTLINTVFFILFMNLCAGFSNSLIKVFKQRQSRR